MGSFLDDLVATNAKKGIFGNGNIVSISYPIGFPILDQQLGAKYIRKKEDGTIITDVHVGIPAGTITMFCGQSQSGKTTAAVQAGSYIVEPFGDDSAVIHRDAEKGTSYDRIQVLNGWSKDKIKNCYRLIRDNNTWENVLDQIIAIGDQKESDQERFTYHTGQYDLWGNEFIYYKPTVIIMDSISKFYSQNEKLEEVPKLMASGREAIYRGNFLRNALEYLDRYNINLFIINHISEAMPNSNGLPKPKDLPHMPNGKTISGGEKLRLYTSSIIGFKPKNDKNSKKSEDAEGWNGTLVDAHIIKSRTSRGGFDVSMEFIEEAGFDPRLTLALFAKDKNLIKGVNPNRYFEENPDIKFDTRKFLIEVNERPEILQALFKACKPELDRIIPVVDTTNSSDTIIGAKSKIDYKTTMREMLNNYDMTTE